MEPAELAGLALAFLSEDPREGIKPSEMRTVALSVAVGCLGCFHPVQLASLTVSKLLAPPTCFLAGPPLLGLPSRG